MFGGASNLDLKVDNNVHTHSLSHPHTRAHIHTHTLLSLSLSYTHTRTNTLTQSLHLSLSLFLTHFLSFSLSFSTLAVSLYFCLENDVRLTFFDFKQSFKGQERSTTWIEITLTLNIDSNFYFYHIWWFINTFI